MEITNVSLQPLDGGPPISLGEMTGAQLTIDPTTILEKPRYGKSFAQAAHGTLTFEDAAMDKQTFESIFGPPSKGSPALDAIVDWDPRRNPAAFWRLMTGLLMKGPGVRWRIRQATWGDRLKGGAIA